MNIPDFGYLANTFFLIVPSVEERTTTKTMRAAICNICCPNNSKATMAIAIINNTDPIGIIKGSSEIKAIAAKTPRVNKNPAPSIYS